MDLASLVGSFQTGTYSVTRRARGTAVRGKLGDGSETTFTIAAAVVPASGADVKQLPQGRQVHESRALFTTTQLYPGGQGEDYEADAVTLNSQEWEVVHVETWIDPVSGGTGYRCLITDPK